MPLLVYTARYVNLVWTGNTVWASKNVFIVVAFVLWLEHLALLLCHLMCNFVLKRDHRLFCYYYEIMQVGGDCTVSETATLDLTKYPVVTSPVKARH